VQKSNWTKNPFIFFTNIPTSSLLLPTLLRTLLKQQFVSFRVSIFSLTFFFFNNLCLWMLFFSFFMLQVVDLTYVFKYSMSCINLLNILLGYFICNHKSKNNFTQNLFGKCKHLFKVFAKSLKIKFVYTYKDKGSLS